ncbi:MAG: hypothetical protein JKY99_04650 [Rhizobiales bacterium]|nr:hypothetical protein [Hyphomicrobiales bacterium]
MKLTTFASFKGGAGKKVALMTLMKTRLSSTGRKKH